MNIAIFGAGKMGHALGMRPVDCGELKNDRLIEAMEMRQIIVQKSLGTNSRSTIKVLS
jgi:predicted dinucleotide-binding enzyme